MMTGYDDGNEKDSNDTEEKEKEEKKKKIIAMVMRTACKIRW